MKRTFNLRLLYAPMVLTLVLGCREAKSDPDVVTIPKTSTSVEATETAEIFSTSTDELERATIDVENLSAPEGVVDSFFRAFFSGDDDGAFQMLTSKAQKAKRGSFVAQESNCVSWRIIGKTKPSNGRVKVLVELEDYDDVGEFQTDRLTFLLTKDDSEWRIARFGIGELEIDFEEQTANDPSVARTAGVTTNETR